ncbi:MAG TPA: class D sortase [Vicinamibacterales bacterium]|nr:class D sortase [Vicinamibacterales bacterium]
MTRDDLLKWIERGLLATGVVLAAWCAAVLVEARFHQSVAVSDRLVVTQTAVPVLPGDSGTAAPRPAAPSAPAAGSLIARLEAPSVRMTTNVLQGSDDGTLRRGAGHIEDTPLFGQPGNIGIAGHRDTVFRPLRNIKVGDPLHITTHDRTFQYRVSRTLIVGPDEVYVLDPTQHPTVTLVTCYPFDFIGHAPKRFIVQAELVEAPAQGQAQNPAARR